MTMTSTIEILLNPGDILYREGDPNDCVYIIESGEVILYTNNSGKREDCERRGAGSIIGELSILTNQPRAVTVEATTTCLVYRISADHILDRFNKIDPILRACIETSINFAAKSNRGGADGAPLVTSTLTNSKEVTDRLRFEQDILKGLDGGEFRMVYQPIVGLGDSSIVGFEALARWQHPILGNIRPDQFIEVAETMGSIGKITDFALIEACAALKKFKATSQSDADLFASVNISGADIGRVGFIDFLAHVLDINELEPHQLSLEVTERAIIPDTETATRNLRKLKELGYGLSMDDFGTGYSNLSYLKNLPLTAIKIDRTFAGDAHSNAVSRSIIKLMVGLGKEMAVAVIAEGLECQDDVEVLQSLGCHLAQGFHFSKPLSEHDFLELIAPGSTMQRNVA